MAITYLTPQFSFVDSQFGTSATSTGIKSLVNTVVDGRYHKTVQKKTWFTVNGMIGPDTYSEGNNSTTAAGYPVIRKTELEKAKGDTIKMGKRSNLATTPSVGIVGGFQLVDAEVGYDLSHQQVKIEQWRQGVLTAGGMNSQRNPYEPFEQTEMDLLSDWTSSVQDNGLLASLHYGNAYHMYRQYGITNLSAAANINTIYGNNTTLATSGTIASLVGDGTDNPKGLTFEIGYTYAAQNDFDLVDVGGSKFLISLISPAARLKLMRDPDFRNALQYARERGIDNPLFKYASFVYANVLIFEYDKVRSQIGGNNPAGLTVSNGGAVNSSITEAVYTGIGGGVTSSQIHHTYFLGANALALAEGPMRMAERIENDYGILIGRAADNIWGAKRMDWLLETSAVGTFTNQSSLVVVNTLIS